MKLSKGQKLVEPYQSLGAHGVKNLAEKILLSLNPPGRPFFRLSVGHFDVEEQVQRMALEKANQMNATPEAARTFVEQMRRIAMAQIEKNLATVEQAIVREFELEDNRPTDSEVMKHLIVGGNAMRYCPQDEDEQPRMYSLEHYVVRRDPDGRVLEQITCEGVDALSVTPEVREACGLEGESADSGTTPEYNLYTSIKRSEDGKWWEVEQELNGVPVPDSEGKYPIDVCPWVALRWTKIDGEDYGRGHVSDYRGSLRSLEGLTRALVENAAGAARFLLFVNPNSQYGTKVKDVARAPNGAVVVGNAQDVTFLRSEKYNDLQVPFQQVQVLYKELGQAFLLNSSTQRNAERVTAYEMSLMAHEIEVVLGGTYSTLGKEYQYPILVNLMARMKKARKLPEIPDEVEPTILTGMDALGRNADLEKLAQFGQFLQMFPQQIVAEYLRFSDIFRQGAVATGVNAENLLKSEEEVLQERQQQMQQALIQQAIGPAINNAGAQAAPPVQQ